MTISVAEVTFCLRVSLFMGFAIFWNRNLDENCRFKWLTFVSDDLNGTFGRSSLVIRRAAGADATVWAQRRLSSCVGGASTVISGSCVRPFDETIGFWVLNGTGGLPRFVTVVGADVSIWAEIIAATTEESRLGGVVGKIPLIVVDCGWFVTSLGRKNGFA